MKNLRRIAAFVLVMILLVTMIPAVFATSSEDEQDKGIKFTEVDEKVYGIIRVNIRSGPSTKYKILGVLATGESIQRVGIGNNGWSKVLYQDQVAYMYTAYLSTSKPSNTRSQVDYSNLTRQIAIANGLEQSDYTRETWEVMDEVLKKANSAMDSTKQSKVDNAADNLKEAISNLLKVDYSALENALMDAKKFAEEQESYPRWTELVEAIAKGKVLLESGDQLAADAAAAEIHKILGSLQAEVEQMEEPQVVIKEVEVEVPPTDDYCNIPRHQVWLILFFVSLTFNVVLAATVVLLYRKKKNQMDDMPLVDYNIDDDI